jgi:hypothetical protein
MGTPSLQPSNACINVLYFSSVVNPAQLILIKGGVDIKSFIVVKEEALIYAMVSRKLNSIRLIMVVAIDIELLKFFDWQAGLLLTDRLRVRFSR